MASRRARPDRPRGDTDASADLVRRADRFASERHAGQTDKNGDPYIEHPRRVAASVSTPIEKAVALLHDTLEDTGATPGDLRAAGFPDLVVETVDLLTRRPNEPAVQYLTRVSGSALAVRVKRADILDNADPARLARIRDAAVRDRLTEKYRHATAVLDELSPPIRR